MFIVLLLLSPRVRSLARLLEQAHKQHLVFVALIAAKRRDRSRPRQSSCNHFTTMRLLLCAAAVCCRMLLLYAIP